MLPQSFVFSSESVGEGHPDKIADYIADSILDACLEHDPLSRVACEVMVKLNCVYIAGEVTSHAKIDYERVARAAIREIGYAYPNEIFHADSVFVHLALSEQSRDIAQGVDASCAIGKQTAEQGAGDQGIMLGYACDHTAELMPAPITFAHALTRELARQRHAGECSWLRPDCKTQVAVIFEQGKPKAIKNVVLSTQHSSEISHEKIEAYCIEHIIRRVLPAELITKDTRYFINPTGKFVIGGPECDAGLTGRKIMVDTYGGWAHHGGGAFSGKDASKVDRSAAYMCRWVAKNIVAAGLAQQVEIQVAYAIGHPAPTSFWVNTFGSGLYQDEDLARAVETVFSFKPMDMVGQLNLLRPIYRNTTMYGHFAKADLPWEQINKTDALRKAMEAYKAM